jgi:hypothetical protein
MLSRPTNLFAATYDLIIKGGHVIDPSLRMRASAQRRRPKKRRRESSYRPFPGRPDDEDPRRRRCTRQPNRTPGQAADITQAAPFLDEVEPDAFIGDKGYYSDALVEKLQQRGITPRKPTARTRERPTSPSTASAISSSASSTP